MGGSGHSQHHTKQDLRGLTLRSRRLALLDRPSYSLQQAPSPDLLLVQLLLLLLLHQALSGRGHHLDRRGLRRRRLRFLIPPTCVPRPSSQPTRSSFTGRFHRSHRYILSLILGLFAVGTEHPVPPLHAIPFSSSICRDAVPPCSEGVGDETPVERVDEGEVFQLGVFSGCPGHEETGIGVWRDGGLAGERVLLRSALAAEYS